MSGVDRGGSELPEFVVKRLNNGVLSFREFMELALYDCDYGYYAGERNPVGTTGDFVTAESISPAFSFAVATLFEEFVARTGDVLAGFVDIGCGDGTLVRSVANDARFRGSDLRFFGVDRSLRRAAQSEGERVDFVTSLDSIDWSLPILVFSNELFDAFPFARLVMRDDGLHELMVADHGGTLQWEERAAPREYEEYFSDRSVKIESGQFADISLEWFRFYGDLAARLRRGLVVTIDYGFPQKQLFDVRIRRFGTAAAFARHQVHRELLASPGEQDLTAHVNFTDLERAGESAGLATLAFMRQAQFLLAVGITQHPLFTPAEEVETESVSHALGVNEEREAARRLILPDGMGEEMRVLVQAHGVATEGWSFLNKLW